MTSLDKYQIVNTVYLAICCVWHSISLFLNIQNEYSNLFGLAVFFLIFILIQVVFTASLYKSYKKVKEIEFEEKSYLARLQTNGKNMANGHKTELSLKKNEYIPLFKESTV